MQLGYRRIAKADGSQALDLQRDAHPARGHITRQTLYRHVSPQGALRPDSARLLAQGRRPAQPTG